MAPLATVAQQDTMKAAPLRLNGQRFGRITINFRSTNPRYWIGTCECNPEVEKKFRGSRLISGKINHCGCQRVNHGHTRGKTRSATYLSWQDMKARCKALQVLETDGTITRTRKHDASWLKFENFLRDMGPRPLGTTLDRINPLGHYGKDNCRWATRQQQDYNKTNTVMYCADPQSGHFYGSALEWTEWFSKQLGVRMSISEFHILLKFFPVEKLFCAVSPLVTFAQLRQRIREEKEKEFAAVWNQPDDDYPDTGYVPCE